MDELMRSAIRVTFADAARYGWTVCNLNDNPHGLVVRGEPWKAERPNGKPMYEWTEYALAAKLSLWMSMTDEEPKDSP